MKEIGSIALYLLEKLNQNLNIFPYHLQFNIYFEKLIIVQESELQVYK